MSDLLPRPPSPGFLMILVSAVATVVLLAWGFSTPDLHRVWELTTRLNQENAAPPTEAEIRSVQAVLRRHPEWAAAAASGRAAALLESPLHGCLRYRTTHVVTSASTDPVHLRLSCTQRTRLRVLVEDGQMRQELSCASETLDFSLPPAEHPRLVRIRRLAGPAFPDNEDCPVRLLGGEEMRGGDAEPEDPDAAKD